MQEPKTIDDIADLQRLVRSGFSDWEALGDVAVKEKDGLLLFNYTPHAQYAGRWNAFERMSRGLILHAATGAVVARQFDKFFNWGEGGQTTNAPVRGVWEKLDGSLGIGYAWQGEWHVATRGSFDSDQAHWAQDRFRARMAKIEPHPGLNTLLFEIIYPGNRVVVDYGDREDLVLLAIRRNHLGDYVPGWVVDAHAMTHEFGRPKVYSVSDIDELLSVCETLDANAEGFVVEFEDDSRYKFKGDAYKELHRLISGLSPKRAAEAVASGTVDAVRERIPDEFLADFNGWVEDINGAVGILEAKIETAFDSAPKGDRKVFARWVKKHHSPYAPYLFLRLDGRPYRPLIFQRQFGVRQKSEETG